ncbi:hypothetical protein [Candidatus Protofrankia datiscae]|nr:hypothetical protein [Candidatus Protofrankia datiscae]
MDKETAGQIANAILGTPEPPADQAAPEPPDTADETEEEGPQAKSA